MIMLNTKYNHKYNSASTQVSDYINIRMIYYKHDTRLEAKYKINDTTLLN